MQTEEVEVKESAQQSHQCRCSGEIRVRKQRFDEIPVRKRYFDEFPVERKQSSQAEILI
jgi:hypothetical protein